MVKFDIKDKKILAELDVNPNIASSQLAKKVGVSRQVAEYRISKLLDQKTIYAFYTMVDTGKLGYTTFRVHIKLKNVTEQQYVAFGKELFHNYPSFWVGFVSGSFDVIADIFAKTPNEFEEVINDILQKNKNIIYGYEVLTLLELDLYEYAYFLESKKERKKVVICRNIDSYKLDDFDRKILQMIKYNSRLPYETVAKSVGLTRNAVKNRIKKLEEKEIIAGYKIFVDFRHFNKLSYKIFIKYNTTKLEQEKQLLEFLKNTPGDLATTKQLGRWNLDIEIHFKDSKELQQFIINLRNRFEIIEDYEFVQLIEDYGIDFYPEKLK